MSRRLVFVDDAEKVTSLAPDPSIVFVALDHDAAFELRRMGARTVRLLSDYATKVETFDDLYAAYRSVVRARLGRWTDRRLFEILEPDIVRNRTVELFVGDAKRRAIREAR